MDQVCATMLLFFSVCRSAMSELVGVLVARMSIGAGLYYVLIPAMLVALAGLLVKYLSTLRLSAPRKLVSGSVLLLPLGWYVDRICRNNAYLLVRSVGVALIACAALALYLATSGNGRMERPEPTVVAAGTYEVSGD